MGFPTTPDELADSGYQFTGPSECKSCGANIDWWETPRGKKIPMNRGTARPHWSTCPNADQHRTSEVTHGRPNAPRANGTISAEELSWLKQQARNCHCVVCKKISGR